MEQPSPSGAMDRDMDELVAQRQALSQDLVRVVGSAFANRFTTQQLDNLVKAGFLTKEDLSYASRESLAECLEPNKLLVDVLLGKKPSGAGFGDAEARALCHQLMNEIILQQQRFAHDLACVLIDHQRRKRIKRGPYGQLSTVKPSLPAIDEGRVNDI